MAPSASDELVQKRETLAEAQRATRAKLIPLCLATLAMTRLLRDEPWLVVVAALITVGLSIKWITDYRRLRVELGLDGEYDELDENTTNGVKTMGVLFGVFGGFFVVVALLVWLMRQH